ncbi:helix-turn-helix domain-containing protein [Croceitalea rosinachiae]|uniref:Helix-turn-helix domain-containing protein n=1 Tax=Croceitalea rosinachiae TaxID=3075596 RepID=A0ABU3A779_9FLAO|nr:helix-turn-helix domain-containing protein [Croceitalea sp. F388]MDT0606019.1 helix-turn-helix domain-containing protein [Croceitalea sp. F388]
MKLEFIIWTLFFLIIAGQGFLLAYLLVSRPNLDKRSGCSLAASVLAFTIMLLFWVGFWNGISNHNILYNLLFYPIPFLLGPSFYDYVTKITNGHSKRFSFHLIPSSITLVYSTAVFIYWIITDTLFIEKDISDFFIYQLHTISFVAYSIASFKAIQKKLNTIQLGLPDDFSLKLVRISVFLFGLFAIFSFTNFFFNRVLEIAIFMDLGLAVLSCVLIYSIGHLGLKQITISSTDKKNIGQYSKSSLKQENTDNLMNAMVSYMEEEKPYLQCNYRIDDLVNATQIPSHHISELLNKYYNQNFSEFTNSYRVKEAIKILSVHDTSYKISSVGYDVGFNSDTTFYAWFKRITGLSPRRYQQKKTPI